MILLKTKEIIVFVIDHALQSCSDIFIPCQILNVALGLSNFSSKLTADFLTLPSLIVGGGSITKFSIFFLRLLFICEDFEKVRPPLIIANPPNLLKVGERKIILF